jgi:glycosyltransferase involved in cell wall biosynthesis
MNIGIVAPELFDGGEVTWTRILIKGLLMSPSNHDLTIYLDKWSEEFLTEFADEPRVTVSKATCSPRFAGLRTQVRSLLTGILQQNKPYSKMWHDNDVVIFPYLVMESLFCTKPYIVCPQDLRHKYFVKKPSSLLARITQLLDEAIYSRKIHRPHRIIVESECVRNDLLKFFGVSTSKIDVAISPPLVVETIDTQGDLDSIVAKYKLPSKFLFYPAQLVDLKNHVRLICALAAVREKYGENINLVLVGSPKDSHTTTMGSIADLGLTSQVQYLGYIPDNEIPAFYKLAHALVMPSLFESVSLPIWEAFRMSLPVLSSNVCALPEQVGDAGLLFDPYAIDDMADKIYAVWSDQDLCLTLSRKGAQRIASLTLAGYSQKLEDTLQAIRNAHA